MQDTRSSTLSGGREEATTAGRFLGATDGSRPEGQTAVVTRRKRFHRYAEKYLCSMLS